MSIAYRNIHPILARARALEDAARQVRQAVYYNDHHLLPGLLRDANQAMTALINDTCAADQSIPLALALGASRTDEVSP